MKSGSEMKNRSIHINAFKIKNAGKIVRPGFFCAGTHMSGGIFPVDFSGNVFRGKFLPGGFFPGNFFSIIYMLNTLEQLCSNYFVCFTSRGNFRFFSFSGKFLFYSAVGETRYRGEW